MSAKQLWLNRFYLSAQTFTVDATPKSTTAGWYYLVAKSGQASLMSHVEDLAQSVQSDATVTFDTTTGKISFGTAGWSYTLTWGAATELQAILGFTSNVSTAAGTDVAEGQARYQWLPANCMSDYPLDKTILWDKTSNTKTVRASDGTAYSIVGPMGAGACSIAYQQLPEANVISTSEPDNGTAEQLWRDGAVKGSEVRVVVDLTENAALTVVSDYIVGLIEMTEDTTSFQTFSGRTVDGWDGLRNVRFPLIEVTE